MKRIFFTLLLLFSVLCGAKAMDYEEARDRAWFLTDKMAYELNLTPDQCERAYQINLDYLMSVRTASDCVGEYWRFRDVDLRCILFDWQYNLYRTLDYFFRPLRWYEARWYYPMFDHYRYGYYYFNRPTVYVSYRGGMWARRGHNAPSPYLAMRPNHGAGMRDQYKRGWVGGNPSPRPLQPNNGFRPDVFNKGNGRPEGRPRSNNGGTPNNRGNNRGPFEGSRPSTSRGDFGGRGGNNRQGHNNTQSGGFRDGYTNYRQTGNGGSVGNSRGSVSPTNTRGTGNTTKSTSRSGRVFGGR